MIPMAHPASHPPASQKGLSFHAGIFVLIIAVSLLVLAVVAYSFQLGYRMGGEFSPLVDATMEIKLEATAAHLWFEEIVSGDRNESIEDVLQHIDNALRYANAMLEGGVNPKGHFVLPVEAELRHEIEAIIVKIEAIKAVTRERYEAIGEAGAGTPLDQKYDAIFESFLKQSDVVESRLQQSIADGLTQYRYLQFFLFFFLVALTAYLLFVFYRYEKLRIHNLSQVLEAHEQVKVLSGLLPICSACKKIRDDKGYWNQIETYIRDHSEADFSHSLCPECVVQLYPELSRDMREP